MIYIILLILGILAILGELLFIFLWVGTRWTYRKEPTSSYSPTACVIVPCKGVDKNFRENINAICNQNYKNYKIIFVTDSTKDPAYSELKDIISNNQKAKIEIAEIIKGCSGKIAALIKGIKTSDDVDVYVFADSDIKPHKDWLRYLISHLNEKKVGATTGFRWYFPHDLRSSFISTWNLASILSIMYGAFNYAWGGSTAISKKLFEELNIEKKWKRGFSDDLILTKAVKQAGLKIKFVPKCVVESTDDTDIHTFFKWGTTQYTWVRWYYPSVWIISFIGIVGLKFLTLLGIGLLITGVILPGLLMISTIFFEMLYGWLGFSTFKKTMWYPKERHGFALAYTIMMPAIFFLISYNMLASLFKREIVWKGRKYRGS